MTLSARTRLLLSLAALLISLVAGGWLMFRARSLATTATRPVPSRLIAPGEIIRASDLIQAEFPAAAVAGTVEDPAALVGRMARTMLRPRVPIAPEMVGELDAGIPPGWGEVALRLPREAALGGGVRAGDPVYVLDLPRQGEPVWLGPFVVQAVEGQEEIILRLAAPEEAVRALATSVVRARAGERVLHLVRLGGAP